MTSPASCSDACGCCARWESAWAGSVSLAAAAVLRRLIEALGDESLIREGRNVPASRVDI